MCRCGCEVLHLGECFDRLLSCFFLQKRLPILQKMRYIGLKCFRLRQNKRICLHLTAAWPVRLQPVITLCRLFSSFFSDLSAFFSALLQGACDVGRGIATWLSKAPGLTLGVRTSHRAPEGRAGLRGVLRSVAPSAAFTADGSRCLLQPKRSDLSGLILVGNCRIVVAVSLICRLRYILPAWPAQFYQQLRDLWNLPVVTGAHDLSHPLFSL